MFKKILRLLVIAGLLFVLGTAITYLSAQEKDPASTQIKDNVPAVKLKQPDKPADLTGKWQSETSKMGTKMVAEIKDNTIFVEIVSDIDKTYTGLWYGTFDILPAGQNSLVSKFIDDPNHFVLSSAETKEFIYQGDSLVFDYSVMGVRTTVEMKRV